MLASKNRLKVHQISVHEQTKNYHCVLCEQSFSSKLGLSAHKKNVHNEIKKERIQCHLCNKSLSKIKLMEHISKVHENIRNHKCEKCGKSFLSNAHLRRHRSVHENEFQNHKCDICKKVLSSKTYLLKHMKMVHGNECDTCTEIFLSKPEVQKHRRDIHKIEDHECDLCSKAFSTKANLKRHKHINHELLDNLS